MPLPASTHGSPELTDRELAAIVAAGLREERHHAARRQARAGGGAAAEAAARSGGFVSFSEYLKHVEPDTIRRRADGAARRDRDQPHVVLPRAAALRVPGRRRSLPALARGAARRRRSRLVRGVLDRRGAVHDRDDAARAARRRRQAASGCSRRTCRPRRSARATAGVYKIDRVAGCRATCCASTSSAGWARRTGWRASRAESARLVEFRAAEPARIGRRSAGAFDFIFCRNVMIYFDRAVQQRVVRCSSSTWRRAATCSSRTPRA